MWLTYSKWLPYSGYISMVYFDGINFHGYDLSG